MGKERDASKEAISEIAQMIENKCFEEAQSKINECMQVKPIRLSLYVKQAQLNLISGKVGKVFSMLDGRINPVYNYPSVSDGYVCFGMVSAAVGDDIDRQKQEHVRKFLRGEESEIRKETEMLEDMLCSRSFEKVSYEEWRRLLDSCYIDENYVLYAVLELYLKQEYPGETYPHREWIYNRDNFGYLRECLYDDVKEHCVIVCDKDSYLEQVLEYVLLQLGFEVSSFDTKDRGLLQYIRGSHGIVFGMGKLLDEISKGNQSYIRRLSPSKKGSKLWSFGWFGSYLNYISRIFIEDCNVLVDRKPTMRFSVVVPARNSAATLRYTLQTILEQDFTGDFEVIVSDNSVADNFEVERLCREIADPRIVYLKTPREFALTKSFEFAYLHTRGEYVIGLGSDDGLLSWTLDKLDQIVSCYAEDEVIGWIRGFYAWPGFNGGQENQFVVPCKPSDGQEILVTREDNNSLLKLVLEKEDSMYMLPMLYINSCFKRSYLRTLLDKTGCLWDGICQDIYMGIVNCCIREKTLFIQYPLTIAGMSNGSAGARTNTGLNTEAEIVAEARRLLQDGNMGNYAYSDYETLSPWITTDKGLLYLCLVRSEWMGILGEEVAKQIDWKKAFWGIYCQLDVRDMAYDRKIHEMRYAAMQHGDEFLKWFDENIYEPGLEPRYIDEDAIEKQKQQNSYVENYTPENGGTLDASKYGVTNIYEAVTLFTQLMKTGTVMQ